MTRSGPATPSMFSAGTEHPPSPWRGDKTAAPAHPRTYGPLPSRRKEDAEGGLCLPVLFSPRCLPLRTRRASPGAAPTPLAAPPDGPGARRSLCCASAVVSLLGHHVPDQPPSPSLPHLPVAVLVARKERRIGSRQIPVPQKRACAPSICPSPHTELRFSSVRVGRFKNHPVRG